MSFYINSTELAEAYYNGSEVKSIYYNNVLVWEAEKWPGWSTATWEDIYNLCKQKQEGKIAAWPDDVVVGATKAVTLSTSVLGSTGVSMILIGIDIDGSGVLTFQAGATLNNTTTWGSSEVWSTSNVRVECQNFYNYCSAKPYIKTLSKGHNGTYTDDTVWVASMKEMGLTQGHSNDFTKGVSKAYPYCSASASNRIRSNKTYWARTRAASGIGYFINASGTQTSNYTTGNYSLVPCFAIG